VDGAPTSVPDHTEVTAVPRPSRRAVALLLAGAVLVACAADGEDRAAVSLDVPEGWEALTGETGPDAEVVERYAPRDGSAGALQVVVGCGEASAEDLVLAATIRPLEGLVVKEVLSDDEVEVRGLDEARRVALVLGPSVPDDATPAVRLDGLYGTADGALIFVELSAPAADHDPARSDEALGSIGVEPGAAATVCHGGTP
jgi:hypothetical protein